MRFTEMSPRLMEEFVNRFQQGATICMACDTVGLRREDYYRWKKQAEEGREDRELLFKKIRAARSDYLWSCVKDIKAAGKKQWQANAWLLERMDPENFCERYRKHKYPQHLIGLTYKEQCDEIFRMLVNGEISCAIAKDFSDILDKMSTIEEKSELKEKIFEYEQAQKEGEANGGN